MRDDTQRLEDVLAAATAIRLHLERGTLADGLHRYFDTDHAIVAATVEHDLPPLIAAVERLRNLTDQPEFELDLGTGELPDSVASAAWFVASAAVGQLSRYSTNCGWSTASVSTVVNPASVAYRRTVSGRMTVPVPAPPSCMLTARQ